MKINLLASCALVTALVGCSGNSLDNPLITPGGPVVAPPQPGDEVTATSPVVVPSEIAFHLKSARVVRGTGGQPDTLLIDMSALDTTPVDATWQRRPDLDIPGYQAFLVQQDALDRIFVGLAASSADQSVGAVVAGSGSQFTQVYSGASFTRNGAYTPPDATRAGSGTGQVSYKGLYAGLLNGGGGRDQAIPIPPDRGTVPSEIPNQPAQVTGNVFVNANFADNEIEGVVKNRNTGLLGGTVALEDVVLSSGTIAANGSFTGVANRPNPTKTSVGDYAGVIGGASGSSIAGAINIDGGVHDRAGEVIEDALERGVFVLDQCGLTATAGGDCLGTAPAP